MRTEKSEMSLAVGRRLRALMQDLGFSTVQTFAEAYGWDRQRVSNWLNGINQPRAEEMIGLMQATGLTLDWLFRGEVQGIRPPDAIRLAARQEGMIPIAAAEEEPESPEIPKAVKRAAKLSGAKKTKATGRKRLKTWD